jgi:hypothetical protein
LDIFFSTLCTLNKDGGFLKKVNTGLLTLLEAAIKVMKDFNEEIIEKVSNIATMQCFRRRPALSMHIVNFPSKREPILCKHTCIC